MTEELIGIIGGTGIGEELAANMDGAEAVEVATPFGPPSGPILVGDLGRRRVAFLNRHGAGHRLGPSQVPYAANIFALKKLGVRAILASAAVGSLRENICPGDLVAVDQFIDRTFRRQGSFFDKYGAVHCEFAEPACGRLRDLINTTAKNVATTIHPAGCYVCMEGPQFSTRAESLMHRAWGGDLIGMTALPEAKLAREAQICYALVALVSDYDCWRPHEGPDPNTLLTEIIGNLKNATANCLALLETVLERDESLCGEQCPCRKSLQYAVWTADKNLGPEGTRTLGVLFE